MAACEIRVRKILDGRRINERAGGALRVGQAHILNYFACKIGVLAVDARVENGDGYIAATHRDGAVLLTEVVVGRNTLYAGGVEVRIGVERERAITVERADSRES